MRKTVSLLLMVAFVLVSVSAWAQPAKRNLNWFNRNYIFGAQDRDAEGNLMWNTDGTPRLGPVKSWTGAFNAYTMVDGKRVYTNPDGNPQNATNLSEMYGSGTVYGGAYLTNYAWWDRGGGKNSYHYPNRDWAANRSTEGKDPISAATPVILNCDFEAVYDWADFCVWNYNGNQRYEWFFRAAKDVTVKYKVAEDDPWETLGTFVFDYPHTVNTNNWGAYRVTNHVYSPMSIFAAGTDLRTDVYHAHRTGKPWSQPLPIEAGRRARYVQFEIASNWAQGLANDPKTVGFNEVTFYKTGAMLAFEGPFDVAPMRSEEYVLPYDSGKGAAGDRDDPNIDWAPGGDIQLWSMGGWPRFWDEGLGDYTTVTYNDVTVTAITGSALADDGAWITNAPQTPFVIQGNHQVRLGVSFRPQTFGEFSEDLAVEWTIPQVADRTFYTTFTMRGKGTHNAWGYIPIYGGKEAASVGGWSDWGYAWRLDYGQNGGSIDEHPDLGWIRGTRMGTARGTNSYNSDGGTGVNGMWHKLDLGRTFEVGEVDEMWVWPSRWYAGNSMKNVEIHVSNDPVAYATDQTIPDFQANGANHTGWTHLSDELFPQTAAPYTAQHKVDFSSAGPFRYVKITCKGGPGEGTWGGGNVSLAKVRFFQKDAVLYVNPDRINWPELNVYTTTETQIVVGNVGDPGHDMTIESIDFVTDRGWTGGGFFSLPTVPSMGLPKVYAAGTTEALTLRYNPLDFGEHKARFLVYATNMDGKTNAWEIECTGRVYEYAPGFIRNVKATANASHDNGGWDEMRAVDGAGMVEYPDALHRGSKQARHAQGGNGWLAGTTQRISEAWIECDLGGVHQLDEMWIWNYCQNANFDAQMKTVYVEYREDEGDSWRQLGGDDMFYTFFGTGVQFVNNPFPATNLVGDGDTDETNNPPLKFNGTNARYVRISTAGGHDVGSYGDSQYAVGLGELRFYSQAGAVRVSPNVMNYGSVAIGASKTNTFDVENESGSPLTVDLVVPLGLNSPFMVTTPGPFTVGAGGAQTVQVQFAPTEVGKWADNKVAVIGSFGVFYVTVHGQSFIAGTPDIQVSPTSLNFGTVYLPINGGAPEPVVLPLDVMNWGDVPLAINDIETSNTSYPAGSDMAFTSNKTSTNVPADPSSTVAGKDTINVSFVPLVVGTFNGQVILTSNDPDESPATVNLTGRAVVTQPAAVQSDDWMLY